MKDSGTRPYWLYLRKSKGVAGISRQRTVTTAHVESLGGHIAGEYSDEDRTAYHKPGEPRPERPGFLGLLAAIAADAGTIPGGVAAWHADRLLRSGGDAEDLIAVCAAGRHPVETPRGGSYDLWTANGRRRMRDDATVAAYEVDHLVERVTEQKRELATAGGWPGGFRPFGWNLVPAPPGSDRKYDGLIINETEASRIRAAATDLLAGSTLYSVATGWNKHGVTNSRGGPWRGADVRRMLLRPWNAGLAVYQGQETGTPTMWDPILDVDVFRALQAKFSGRSAPGIGVRVWPGSGLYLCGAPGQGGGYCDAPLKSRHAHERVVYAHDGHVARSAETLDEYVIALIGEFLDQPGAAEKLRPRQHKEDTAPMHARISVLRDNLDGLGRHYAAGRIGDDQLVSGTAEARAEIAALEARIAAAAGISPLDGLADSPSPRDRWERLVKSRDIGRIQAVIRLLMTVRVLPAGRGRPMGSKSREKFFRYDRIDIDWKAPPMPPPGD